MKLTKKQQIFADAMIADPKLSATQAALKTYGKPDSPVNYNTARSIASENLAKPAIMEYLGTHSRKAEQRVIEAMDATKPTYRFNTDSKTWELVGTEDDHAIRLKAADSLLDRVHGKATQKTEVTTTVLQIGIDLSMLANDDAEEGELVE
jgi:hypothetical protein